MSTPTTQPTRNPHTRPFDGPYRKAVVYLALVIGIIFQADLTTGPLSVVTTHRTTTFILAAVIIAATTFCAYLTGRTWHTHPRAVLFGTTTALLSATQILAVLATPYLYTKTHTAHTGYTFLESLTWRTDYTMVIIHTVFILGTTTIAALYGHQTKHNH